MISLRRRPADATIARLEVHADGGDPIAARLRIERLLGGLDLMPRALPPAAILCVREMRDPLPGRLSLASRQLGPPPAWEQALRREVDRLASAAAWPARAAVPPTSEAVAFADEAELLTCLGSDLAAGGIPARWWWRLLVRGLDDPRAAVAAEWRRSVEHAPVALERLARRGMAGWFLRALDDADVRALAAAIAERFALPVLASITTATQARRRPTAAASLAAVAGAQEATQPPPWRALAPEAEEAALTLERRALLGIVLALVRAPTFVRSATFATRVTEWRAALEATPAGEPLRSLEPLARQSPAAQPSPEEAKREAAGAKEVKLDEEIEERVAEEFDDKHGERVAAVHAREAGADVSRPTHAEAKREAPIEAVASRPEESAQPPAPSPLEEAAAPAPSAPGAEPVEPGAAEPPRWLPATPRKLLSLRPRTREFGPAIDTQLGGLFYLLNLALYLRLYGDDENLELSPWDFVELAGRKLLDGRAPDDPVWPLLAALSGRDEDEPAGADFAPPLDWRLPEAWLSPFAASSAEWSISQGRLIVVHGAGFVLLDLPAEMSLENELARYGDLSLSPSPSPPLLLDAPLERWLSRLVPFLRERLRVALALEPGDEVAALLLLHQARVHLTDTNLDVVLSLEHLPVAIRRAGLDRDPGWVAAAGRFIAFHFE